MNKFSRYFQKIIYASTIFFSAFLLFQIQPLISKAILPWFGGSPSVWTIAMLFFQTVLCAGYFYAHLLSEHPRTRNQAFLHLFLLILASILAPLVVPDISMRPTGQEHPSLKILSLLTICVGIPYFCLSTTAPLIQRWIAQTTASQKTFRLYALSNLGSLIALLSFPYIFEPNFDLKDIGLMWTYGFWVFAVLCGLSMVISIGPSSFHSGFEQRKDPVRVQKLASLSRFRVIRWIFLPAAASLMFISTTDHVSHDISPEPRLWITTLGLYLITFIICFDHPRWYKRRYVAIATLIGIVALSGHEEIPRYFGIYINYSLDQMRWAHLIVMFFVCFLCHGELYRSKPEDPREITKFYLMISIGGTLAGIFVALIATNLFANYYEWSLVLISGILLSISVLRSEYFSLSTGKWISVTSFVAAELIVILVLFFEDPFSIRVDQTDEYRSKILYQNRNFYGVITVLETQKLEFPQEKQRTFFSGRIVHGTQSLQEGQRRSKTAYFSEESGVGETLLYAMSRKESLRVAVVGLGVGTLINYGRKNDEYDLFEINPAVVEVANTLFTNISDAEVMRMNFILGDARLKFESLLKDRLYDVIILDAFSGDSVPVHLLTKEAFALYERHLVPDGFIVSNISNRYLNLYPVIKSQAKNLGMGFRNKVQPADPSKKILANHFAVMTRDTNYLARFPSYSRDISAEGWDQGQIEFELPNLPVWSDSFSSLESIQYKR